MKLHEIVIAIGFAGFIFLGFMLLFADGAVHYGNTDMDVSKLQKINQSLTDINTNTQQVSSAMQSLQGVPSVLDIFGTLLIGAYGSMITAVKSGDIAVNIMQDSANYLPFGNFQGLFYLIIGISISAILFIAILGHFLSKSERM